MGRKAGLPSPSLGPAVSLFCDALLPPLQDAPKPHQALDPHPDACLVWSALGLCAFSSRASLLGLDSDHTALRSQWAPGTTQLCACVVLKSVRHGQVFSPPWTAPGSHPENHGPCAPNTGPRKVAGGGLCSTSPPTPRRGTWNPSLSPRPTPQPQRSSKQFSGNSVFFAECY